MNNGEPVGATNRVSQPSKSLVLFSRYVHVGFELFVFYVQGWCMFFFFNASRLGIPNKLHDSANWVPKAPTHEQPVLIADDLISLE